MSALHKIFVNIYIDKGLPLNTEVVTQFNPKRVSSLNPQEVSLTNPEGVSLLYYEMVILLNPKGASMVCEANS